MFGFAWLGIRQAQEALKNGRLEEAHRLLCQPAVQGHKRSWELLMQVAQGLVARGEQHLRYGDSAAAWNDLVAAEQVGTAGCRAGELRQSLTRRGLAHVRNHLEAGEAARAAEVADQLRQRAVQQAELETLEEAAKTWVRAGEQADRGEFAQALSFAQRVRRLLPAGNGALEEFVKELELKQQKYPSLLGRLHNAMERKDWKEVLHQGEAVLALAPQHAEARRARALAWKAYAPDTVAAPKTITANGVPRQVTSGEQRFFLWIDGVGGFLVCTGTRVTIGQATPDTYVDIPLFADVSRLHAALVRDNEGYLLEATRPVLVNNTAVDRALLRSGDRLTLGGSCQLQFQQGVPVSASARLDLVSGHRLHVSVDAVLLMADTLVLGSGAHVHVTMPDLQQNIVLFRQRDGLGIRYGRDFSIDGQKCQERGTLRSNSTVTCEEFVLAVEPVEKGSGSL